MGDPDFQTSREAVYSTFSVFCGIGCGCALGGNLSGASMNPSNAIAALLVAFLNTGNHEYLLIGVGYFVTPILAAISVANFYIEVIKNGENPFAEKTEIKVKGRSKADF